MLSRSARRRQGRGNPPRIRTAAVGFRGRRRYKRMPARGPARPIGGPVHYFKRKTDAYFDFSNNLYNNALITTGAANVNIKLMGFALRCIPNYDEFKVLFKYYKILGVKVNLMLGANVNDLTNGNGVALPVVYTCWAPDDNAASTPLTIQTMREKANTRTHVMGDRGKRLATHYVKRPCTSDEIGDQAGNGNILVASAYKGWLPTANDRIVHNGLFVAVDNIISSVACVVKTEFTYYFACKIVV